MPPKRKASTKDAAAADKKRRTTRASRQPVAPPSIELNMTHAALNNFNATTIASILSSDNPDQVASALNALLRASSDVDVNYCLGTGGEKILKAMVKLFDEAVGWEEEDGFDGDNEEDGNKFEPTVKTWDAVSLSGINERWRNFCRDKLASPLASSSDSYRLIDPDTDAKIMDMIVAILRNLSYVAQNLRFLYYSEGVLRLLTGALYYRGYSTGGGSAGDDRSGEDVPSSSHQSNMCVHSIQTLLNMAPLLDVTGRQLFIDRMFLESGAKEVVCTVPGQKVSTVETEGAVATAPTPDQKKGCPKYGLSSHLGFGGMHLAKQYDTKAETLENIPNSVVWGLVGSHIRSTLAIFPALSAILDPNDITTMSTSATGWHRPSVHAVLEFLTALIENPDNKGIFLCVPDSLLHRLTDMLFMPRLGPDSMDYIDPVSNVVTRVVALKLRMGYDATVDSDMRDRACELLVKLTDLSTSIKRRVGMASSMSGMARRKYDVPRSLFDTPRELTPTILRSDETSSSRRINVRLYDSLLSMISSSSGRGDSGPLAVRLLSNLALVSENKPGILYVERKLIAMSGKDPHIANIACNGIFNRVK
eukprot:CAMPEP_0196159210 /NCGR_PEP_ID=MMETSP0910-20130528/46207_1 /TAXON_ID=49265 /ORGANISM="Thalassiosira rotula, Strain GSO102" /LENGTH=590 /DNA_ID=CAMNT_0041424127 /DNA_START=209 /DNA_END=1981 /DNA_ORIENTATION=-